MAPGGRPGFALVTLHNHGRSPAIVRDFYHGTIRCVGLPEPLGYPPLHSALHKDEVIPAGKSGDPWRFAEAAFLRGDDQVPTDPDGTYWIIGQVRYADVSGSQYVTGFCFALNSFSGKFYGMGGSPYNHRRRLTKEEIHQAEISNSELPIRR
ncbi:hypothetical protein MKK88_14130 [Methylobacterium sp. E-005]|uniref:hypothetical protein n=1 Tax=Methylobacterium sp. E-005 TaxID=2836549 RepID=UPI001FBB2228|nr:hypothetical protein [Methylobacterium sp. E-005]MCJ2087116.1 hypothetical protein [Methylobacterium sp. E-005]